MENLLPISTFSATGRFVMGGLLLLSVLGGLSGMGSLVRQAPVLDRINSFVLTAVVGMFGIGFLLIAWFHYQIYSALPLELPQFMAEVLNRQLDLMNSRSAYALPLYDPQQMPRYVIPLWIEHEKYYFWFMCYAVMALIAFRKLRHHRFQATLMMLLAVQVCIMYFLADPFKEPLPRFFEEVAPWFGSNMAPMARFGFFMRLYPKMVFYYNASYMWFHPPLLFLAYACITITFVTSLFMLFRREFAIETLGYSYAKFGYFMLTLGMLLGYPWALKAWGPNWWWDPKICSSIMMWAVFSTYLHTRLYANKKGMWYFSSALGIICFAAMVFTLLASFYFPGEHTFQ